MRENLRNLGGRPRKFNSVEEYLNKFFEYCEWANNNPIITTDGIKLTEGEKTTQANRIARPLTIDGWCAFANIGNYSQFKKDYIERGFGDAIAGIERVIRENQISGAAVGIYRENLVARLNGLTDRKDVTSAGKRVEIEVMKSKHNEGTSE